MWSLYLMRIHSELDLLFSNALFGWWENAGKQLGIETSSIVFWLVDSVDNLPYANRNLMLDADGIQWYMLMALFCKLGITWNKMGCKDLLKYGQDLRPLPGKLLYVMALLRQHFSCFYLERGLRDQYLLPGIGLSTRCWILDSFVKTALPKWL